MTIETSTPTKNAAERTTPSKAYLLDDSQDPLERLNSVRSAARYPNEQTIQQWIGFLCPTGVKQIMVNENGRTKLQKSRSAANKLNLFLSDPKAYINDTIVFRRESLQVAYRTGMPGDFLLDLDNKNYGFTFDDLQTLEDAVAFFNRKRITPKAIINTHPGGFHIVISSCLATTRQRYAFTLWLFDLDPQLANTDLTSAKALLRSRRLDTGWFEREPCWHVARVPGSKNSKCDYLVRGIAPQNPTFVNNLFLQRVVFERTDEIVSDVDGSEVGCGYEFISKRTIHLLATEAIVPYLEFNPTLSASTRISSAPTPVIEVPKAVVQPQQERKTTQQDRSFYSFIYTDLLQDLVEAKVIAKRHVQPLAEVFANQYSRLRKGEFRWCVQHVEAILDVSDRQAKRILKFLRFASLIESTQAHIPGCRCRSYRFGAAVLKVLDDAKIEAPSYCKGKMNEYILWDIRWGTDQGWGVNQVTDFVMQKQDQRHGGVLRSRDEVEAKVSIWRKRKGYVT